MIEKSLPILLKRSKKLLLYKVLPSLSFIPSSKGLSSKRSRSLQLFLSLQKKLRSTCPLISEKSLPNVQIHPLEELYLPQTHWINPGCFYAIPLPHFPQEPEILFIHCWTKISHRRNPPYPVYIKSQTFSSLKELWTAIESKWIPHLTQLDDPVNYNLPFYWLNHPVLLDLWETEGLISTREWDRQRGKLPTLESKKWTYFNKNYHSNLLSEESSIKTLSKAQNQKIFRMSALDIFSTKRLNQPIKHWFQLQSSTASWLESKNNLLLAAKELGTLHLKEKQQIHKSLRINIDREGELAHPKWTPSPYNPNTLWEKSLYSPHYKEHLKKITLEKKESLYSGTLPQIHWQPYHIYKENPFTLNWTPQDKFHYKILFQEHSPNDYQYSLDEALETSLLHEELEELNKNIPLLPIWYWSTLEQRKRLPLENFYKFTEELFPREKIDTNPDLFRRAHLYVPEKEPYIRKALEEGQTKEPIQFDESDPLHYLRFHNILDDPLHSLYHWILLHDQSLTDDIIKTWETSWLEYYIPTWSASSYRMHELNKLKQILEAHKLQTWAAYFRKKVIKDEWHSIKTWTSKSYIFNNLIRTQHKASNRNNLTQEQKFYQQTPCILFLTSISKKEPNHYSHWRLEKKVPYWILNTILTPFLWETIRFEFLSKKDKKQKKELHKLWHTYLNYIILLKKTSTLNKFIVKKLNSKINFYKKILNLILRKISEWQEGIIQKGNILSREHTLSRRLPITLTEANFKQSLFNLLPFEKEVFKQLEPSIQKEILGWPKSQTLHYLRLPDSEPQTIPAITEKTDRNDMTKELQEPNWLYLWDSSLEIQNLSKNFYHTSIWDDVSKSSVFLKTSTKQTENTYKEWIKKLPLSGEPISIALPAPITNRLFKNWNTDYKKWHSCLHPNHPLKSFNQPPKLSNPFLIQETIRRLQMLDLPWTNSLIQEENFPEKENIFWERQPFHNAIYQERNLKAFRNWCEQAVLLITLSIASLEITINQRHNISLWSHNSIASLLQVIDTKMPELLEKNSSQLLLELNKN